MIRARAAAVFIVVALFGADVVAGQSSHLNALEGAVPTPVVEPTAGVFPAGLGALWSDPTAAPSATGLFMGIRQSSYASVRVVQAVAAFRLGPRWSLTIGESEIPHLFDSSLTGIDPSLASLRAQAWSLGIDGAARISRLTWSAGVAVLGDDNVGDLQTSSIARVHARLAVTSDVSLGVRLARIVGGSLPSTSAGRLRIDVNAARTVGAVRLRVAGAVSRGRLWQLAETGDGAAVAVVSTVASLMDLGVGFGRYTTTFGASRHEWYRSAVAALRLGSVRVSGSYTSTLLGAGSGFGVSIGYESTNP